VTSDRPAGTLALILAGGLGTRIRAILGDLPKTMAPVAGRPFLEHLFAQLRGAGFGEVVLLTGHRSQKLERHFGEGRSVGLRIHYSRESAPRGTAGAVRLAAGRFHAERYLVLNGDSFLGVSLKQVLQHHLRDLSRRPTPATIVATRVDDAGRYGRVEVGESGDVLRFLEKDREQRSGLINAGIYVLERALVESIPRGRQASLEVDVFPRLAGKGLRGMIVEAPFIDIGVPEDYRSVAEAPWPFVERAS